jgi:TonB family protein
MNRLNKKCYIASAAFHGLLLGVFLFGSAFLVPQDKPEQRQMLKVYDPSLLNDGTTTGGNPNVAVVQPSSAPAATPPTPVPPTVVTPPVQPPPKPQVEVPKSVVPPKLKTKPVPEKDIEPVINKTKPSEDPPKPKKPKVVIDPKELQPTTRTVSKPTPKDTAQADAKAAHDREVKEAKEANRRATEAIGRMVKNISNNTSSRATPVEIFGPGGGGPLSAGYKDLVASKYTSAWVPPPDLSDETATVIVSITISSDGNVINGRITKRSGNAAMDRSIQTTLDNVTYIAPFPKGSEDRERTYTLTFNLQAKRSIG